MPVAIADQSGERVITLKLSNDIYRYAVLFNWVEGDMPTVEVDPTAFEQLGQITAKLHAHSKTWQAPENFQRIVWNHETMVGADGHSGKLENALI